MVIKEFFEFLRKYNIVALAVAVVMGTASTSLVNSLVKDIFMPMVSPLLSSDSWKEATYTLGPITLAYGSFLAEALNFIILSFIVFFIVNKLFKEHKKDETKGEAIIK